MSFLGLVRKSYVLELLLVMVWIVLSVAVLLLVMKVVRWRRGGVSKFSGSRGSLATAWLCWVLPYLFWWVVCLYCWYCGTCC